MKKLIILACALFTLKSQAQNLNDSLIICMPMNNSASDFSGHSNNGTLVSSPTPTVGHTGVASTAYHFSGSSYINIPTSSSIDRFETFNAISVSVWVKINGWSQSHTFPVIERYYASSPDDGWQLNLFDHTTGTGVDEGFASNGLYGLGVYDASYIPHLTTGSWIHCVLVYSQASNVCKYYINGVQKYSHTLSSPTALFNTHHGDLRIGYSQSGVHEFANGDMDDLRVYDRVLSATEVYQLFADTTIGCSTTTSTVTPPLAGCCLGNECGNTQNALANDYEIPMNGYNFNYTMGSHSASEVLIGHSACTSGAARLDVTDDAIGNAIKGYCSTGRSSSIGVYGIGNSPADNNNAAVGVLGESGALARESGYNAGVAGFCNGASNLTSLPFGQTVGVYGNATLNKGTWAGYFDGDVNITGNLWNNTSLIFSDKRFKKDIVALDNVSARLQKLNSYSYTFRTSEFKEKNFDDKKHIGFIAQELMEVFPELVRENSKGYYAVDYQGMIPVLLQAFKEQAAQNASLQQQVNELKALINPQTGSTASGMSTAVPVTLSDKNVVVLNQNVPNPFAESTTISYNIPATVSTAQIVFTSSNGTIVKTVDIKERGQGTLNVFASDLSHGMYSYTLVIDGKNADTKKMIKQ